MESVSGIYAEKNMQIIADFLKIWYGIKDGHQGIQDGHQSVQHDRQTL